jgi:hypothetical protein
MLTASGAHSAVEARERKDVLAVSDRRPPLVAMLAVLFGVAMMALPASAADPCPEHLFVIERSKNANIVAYDANLAPTADFVASEPVKAYWLMNAKKGEREELNVVERQRAYGFDVVPGDAPATYVLTFKAGKKRQVTIRKQDGCPTAIIAIGGRSGILGKLFVKSKEGFGRPTIEYVELFGKDVANGEPLYEKFSPGK